jgi:hypothetical protein
MSRYICPFHHARSSLRPYFCCCCCCVVQSSKFQEPSMLRERCTASSKNNKTTIAIEARRESTYLPSLNFGSTSYHGLEVRVIVSKTIEAPTTTSTASSFLSLSPVQATHQATHLSSWSKKTLSRQMKRFAYDTSSSESFDITEGTDTKDRSPHEESLDRQPEYSLGGRADFDGRRIMEVKQIEVVRRTGSIDDTASFVTDASGVDDFDVQLYQTMRTASDGSSSAPPPPISLHRERTAPTSNLISPSRNRGGHADTSTSSTLEQPGSTSERLMPPTRKSTPLNNSLSVPGSNKRKPSPCPANDQPSRPLRKASPGYHKAMSGTKATPPARLPSSSNDKPHAGSGTTMKKELSHKWKSIDFNGQRSTTAKPKSSTNNSKPPLVPKGHGQRRWREGPQTNTLDSVERMESQSTPGRDSSGSCTTYEGFESDGRRLSSLTFLTNQAPAAPGEAHNVGPDTSDKTSASKEIFLDGRYVKEEDAPLNDSSKITKMVMSTCGQTIPRLIYEDIVFGEGVSADLPSRMPSSSTESHNRSEGSHVHTCASMSIIPEVEYGSVEAPARNIQTTAHEDITTTPQRRSSRWRLSQSLRSLMTPLSFSLRPQSSREDNPNSSNGRITSDHESSRRTIRSLITASWSLVLPSRRLESAIKPVVVKVERKPEVKRYSPWAKIIYGLIVSCVILTAVIICLSILLARRDASGAGVPATPFPTSAPTAPGSFVPTVEIPSKPGDETLGPREVAVGRVSERGDD